MFFHTFKRLLTLENVVEIANWKKDYKSDSTEVI